MKGATHQAQRLHLRLRLAAERVPGLGPAEIDGVVAILVLQATLY